MRHIEEDGADGEIGDCRIDGVFEVVGGIHDRHTIFLRFHFRLVEPCSDVFPV